MLQSKCLRFTDSVRIDDCKLSRVQNTDGQREVLHRFSASSTTSHNYRGTGPFKTCTVVKLGLKHPVTGTT